MKKLLMLALAVLGVTAAQALTLTTPVSFDNADKFYASVIIKGDSKNIWNAATSGAARPDMVTLKDSKGVKVMDINLRKESGWYLQVNGTDHRLDDYLADITVVFEATKIEKVWSAISVTVSGKNGDDVRTLNGTITDTSIINDIASIEIGAAIGGVSIGEVTVTAGDVTVDVVPEPTVLALLALGVAGMALKRKVA